MVASRHLGGDFVSGEVTVNPPYTPTTSKENTCWYRPYFIRNTREKHPKLKELFTCKTSVTEAYTILRNYSNFRPINIIQKGYKLYSIKDHCFTLGSCFSKKTKQGKRWTNNKRRMYKPRHNWAFYVPSWPALQYREQRCNVNYYNTSFFSSSKTFS